MTTTNPNDVTHEERVEAALRPIRAALLSDPHFQIQLMRPAVQAGADESGQYAIVDATTVHVWTVVATAH